MAARLRCLLLCFILIESQAKFYEFYQPAYNQNRSMSGTMKPGFANRRCMCGVKIGFENCTVKCSKKSVKLKPYSEFSSNFPFRATLCFTWSSKKLYTVVKTISRKFLFFENCHHHSEFHWVKKFLSEKMSLA